MILVTGQTVVKFIGEYWEFKAFLTVYCFLQLVVRWKICELWFRLN